MDILIFRYFSHLMRFSIVYINTKPIREENQKNVKIEKSIKHKNMENFGKYKTYGKWTNPLKLKIWENTDNMKINEIEKQLIHENVENI